MAATGDATWQPRMVDRARKSIAVFGLVDGGFVYSPDC
jgi:hypothetical protein